MYCILYSKYEICVCSSPFDKAFYANGVIKKDLPNLLFACGPETKVGGEGLGASFVVVEAHKANPTTMKSRKANPKQERRKGRDGRRGQRRAQQTHMCLYSTSLHATHTVPQKKSGDRT